MGLIPSQESGESEALIDRLGRELEGHLDLDKILAIAQSAEAPQPWGLPAEASAQAGERGSRLRSRASAAKGVRGKDNPKIGIIRDIAFDLYYPENFEALREAGADLMFIDALRDRLPQVDGLYIGGGFPEFFLKELEGNKGLRQDIAEAIENDLPVYAECAGLMYLCQKIHWQGQSYEMVGVIPAEVQMMERPQGHGYVVAEVTGENPFFSVGSVLRGHEFHHSKLSLSGAVEFAYHLRRGHGIHIRKDGIVYKNLFASYTHLHALGTPEWAVALVSLAAKRKEANVRSADRMRENFHSLNGN